MDAHLSVQAKGCEGTVGPPGTAGGLVTTIDPGSPSHIRPFSVKRTNPPGKLGSGSLGLIFFGVADPTRISAVVLRFLPKMSSTKAPAGFLSSRQPLTKATSTGVPTQPFVPSATPAGHEIRR